MCLNNTWSPQKRVDDAFMLACTNPENNTNNGCEKPDPIVKGKWFCDEDCFIDGSYLYVT